MHTNASPELVAKVAERLRALGDENRLRLLMRLREGPSSVSTLTEGLGLAQPSVSKHLGVLKQVGLVRARREGNQMIYFVHDASIFDLCTVVCEGVVNHLRDQQQALGLAPATRKED